MSAPTSGIHPLAVVGQPGEHREHRGRHWVGKPFAARPNMVAVDPSALLEAFVTVDAGIHEPTTIGAGTWLMKHCHIGHDAQVGADCELAPGTVIGGHAVLGDGVRCGIGVLVRPFVKVGDGARLGAGAVVVGDVPAGEVWVGNPACEIGRAAELRRVLGEVAAHDVWADWFESRSS